MFLSCLFLRRLHEALTESDQVDVVVAESADNLAQKGAEGADVIVLEGEVKK